MNYPNYSARPQLHFVKTTLLTGHIFAAAKTLKNLPVISAKLYSFNSAAKITLLCAGLLLVACAMPPASQGIATAEPTEPAWYYNLTEKPDLLYGYVSGADDAAAKKVAFEHIATQIRTQVKSQSQIITSERLDSLEGLQYFSEQDSETFINSEATLIGARPERRSLLDGKVYVAYSYDNRPLLTRIQTKAGCAQQLAIATRDREGYLEQTPLLQALRASGCQRHVDLHKRSGLWYLNYASQDFWLTSGDIRAGIFSNQHSPGLQLELSQGSLLDKNSYFFINFSHQPLAEMRYVSIFHVDEFGNVQSLLLNQIYTEAGAKLTYPNPDNSKGLRVAPLHDDTYTEELILAFSCSEERRQLKRFLSIGENKYNPLDEGTRQLALLLQSVRNCDFAAASYRIAPNS